MRQFLFPCLAAVCCLVLPACEGMQSALDPAGREAERVARLIVWMAIAAAAIWAAVVALALYAPRAREPRSSRPHTLLIVGGGVIFPIVVLTAHLTYGLSELPGMLARAPDGGMTIEVTGAQWWWRVRYLVPGREAIELANEVWLPVNERVNVRLMSRDVIHSFWAPSLAGKLDAIPGRLNVLPLEPTRTGTYRGACAEFCGASHARMNLVVAVVERAQFDQWLAGQSQPAASASTDVARRGERGFLERGCSACHTIRGTLAQGRLGPDLTHVATRQTLAAGTLPTSQESLRQWIAHTEAIKPEVHMPAFAGLPDDELTALATYLMGLK